MTAIKKLIKGANKASKRRNNAVVVKNGNKISKKSIAAVRSDNYTKRAKYRADRDAKIGKYKYTSRATLYGSAGAASAADDVSSSSKQLEDTFNQTKPQGDIHTDTPSDQSQEQIQTFEAAETSTNPAPTDGNDNKRNKPSDEDIWGTYTN